jgi:hypothetical protein
MERDKEEVVFTEERYSALVKSAHDKQYYNKKSIPYNFKQYRGQQSNNRFVPLCDAEDYQQLRAVRVILAKMEAEINKLLDRYKDECK